MTTLEQRMENNRLRRLRRIARNLGYSIEKGYVHYITVYQVRRGVEEHWCSPVYINQNGEKETGYIVKDDRTGFYVWGSYNDVYDHLWNLDDVESFLKREAEKTERR